MLSPEERTVGMLVAAGVGDSLGLPWEGESSRVVERETMGAGPWDHFDGRTNADVVASAAVAGISLGPSRVGEYTDDTQCLVALSDSLIEMGGLSGEHSALTTALHWAREPVGGYSALTFKKLTALARGSCRYNETDSLGEPSYANGCLMRIAPLAAAYRNVDDVTKLRTIVTEALVWSHTHEEAIDATVVLVVALITCLKERPVDLRALAAVAVTDELKQRLQAVADKVTKEKSRDKSVFDAHDKEFLQSICTPDKWFQIRAIDCLAYVLYVFGRYGVANPEEAMVRMIALGGDCDTTACILGALLGAYHGSKWIPERWLAPLKRSDLAEWGARLAPVRATELMVVDEAKIEALKHEVASLPLPVRHQQY